MKQINYNSMIWFLLRASLVGSGTSIILSLSGRDSLICIFISFILGFIPLILFHKFKYVFINNKNYIFNIITSFTVFIFIFILYWNLIHFISTEFLYKTPLLIISICFIIPIFYASTKSINTINKLSLICFYFVLLSLVLIILGLTKEIKITNLFPIFETNKLNLIKSIFFIFVYNVLPLFILTMIDNKKIENYSIKKTMFFYSLTFLSILNFFFILISCFSVELSNLYDYAEFHIFKRVSLGDFIDKVESFLSIEWIIGLIISIIIGIQYLKKTYISYFSLKYKNAFVFIICLLLALLSSFSFQNLTSFQNFVSSYLIIFIFIGFFICPLIFILKKRLHKPFIN